MSTGASLLRAWRCLWSSTVRAACKLSRRGLRPSELAAPRAAAPPTPPRETTPAAAPRETAPPEAAAAPVTDEHPSPGAVHESTESTPARAAAADPNAVPTIGSEPQSGTRVGVGEHEVYIRRGPRGVEVGMCSGVCGPLRARIEEFQARIRESDPTHQALEDLKARTTDLE